jgi:hypothetical protein
MGYRLPAWGVTAAIVLAGAYATGSRCPGCLPRDRVNTGCQWTGDATFVFDGRQAAHRIHLVEDAGMDVLVGIMLFLMMAVIVARRGPAASIVTDGPAPGLTLR